MNDFKPITIVGLNSKSEIEFDINLIMEMYHAYISYLPIEQRIPNKQLLIAKQMLVFQDLYNAEQAANEEYMEKKAAEAAVKAADVGPHYKSFEDGDVVPFSTNMPSGDLKEIPCPLCGGSGIYDDGYGSRQQCTRCKGNGLVAI